MTRRKMEARPRLKKWTGIMEDHFDDVEKHDRILIAFPDPQTVVFSTNDSPPQKVVDRGFAVAFKDLWLGDNIRNKAFKRNFWALNKPLVHSRPQASLRLSLGPIQGGLMLLATG